MNAERPYLEATRAAYDTVAVDYLRQVSEALAGMPLERSMLAAFAEFVLADDLGPVADLGCGPGHVTAHLRSLGVDAFGIDLSPEMIAVARRTYPELSFGTGSMTALDLADGSLGGIVAFYSTVHTPPEVLPKVFAEFTRVLVPGGQLLLAFKVGDKLRHLDHGYGHDLSLDVYWLPLDRVLSLLRDAGLEPHAQLVREPTDQERPRQGQQGFVLAHRP